MTRSPIRLLVADIDGCVTAGGRSFVDLEMLARVREWSRLAAEDPAIPPMVFCTGRPIPYVAALAQATGSLLPSIAEFGAVIWCPRRQSHFVHPAYGAEDRARYGALLAEAERTFADEAHGVLIEAGKLCQLTFYPRPPLRVPEMAVRVADFAARWSEHYAIDETPAVINFMPRAVNKGTALDWLAGLLDIPTSQMAGLGDSESDWLFMQRCGLSAAPTNARASLRAQCEWALDSGPGDCLVEFYERVIAWNREAMAALEAEAAGG